MTNLSKLLHEELAPTPNRLARTILIALLCGLVVLASKTLSLPETALSAYLIFFVSKEEASISIATAIKLIIVIFVVIALVIFFFILSSGEPMLRIMLMFTITFACMYLAQATSAGVIAATIGMVFFELLSLLDYLPFPNLVLRGLFWILTIIIVPMGILVVANLLFGPSAINLLRDSLTRRLKLIARAMIEPSEGSTAACRKEFLDGGANLTELRNTASLTGRMTKHMVNTATHLQDVTTRLLARCAAGLPPDDTPNNRLSLRLNKDATQVPEDLLLQELAVEKDSKDFPEVETHKEIKDPNEPMRFAIKATLSVAICYMIFTLTHWPAIHTITITAFLVSLGTSTETLHKATLRIIGCLIGAVISFFCLLVIIPSLSNVSELAVLTVLVALPAAWIAVGSENVSYLGMQIAMVFFLSVLNTTGPSVDMGIAWGRIVGIVLGNLVVASVFLTLWPSSGVQRIKSSLKRAITILVEAEKNRPGQGVLLGKACDELHKTGKSLAWIHSGLGLGISTDEQANYLSKVHGELKDFAVSATVAEGSRLDKLMLIKNRLDVNPGRTTLASESF